MRDAREILKTILTTNMTGGSQGGLMLPEQTNKFIDLTLEYSSMLKMVRVERKTNARGELDTLNVGDVVSEGATEEPVGNAVGDSPPTDEEVKPDFAKLDYTMKKIRSLFDMSTESLLDNIEAEQTLQAQADGSVAGEPTGSFRDTIMQAYAKRISSDLELLAIKGDSTIVSTATKLLRLLKSNDGWDVITSTGCHYVDAGYKNVSIKLFGDMLASLPAPYLKAIKDLRWFVGPRLYIKWMTDLAARLTVAGDQALLGNPAAPLGIPLVMVPLIPEDKTDDDGTVTQTGLTFIWLTFPENFIFLQRRYIETYWEFRPRRDKWENTTYSETDMMVENKDAIVKATNVKVDSSSAYGA